MDSIVGEAERFMVRRNPDEYDSSNPGNAELMGHGCFTMAKQFSSQAISGKIVTIANTGYRCLNPPSSLPHPGPRHCSEGDCAV